MKISKMTLLAVLVAGLNIVPVALNANDMETPEVTYYEESREDYVPVATPVVEGTADVVRGGGRIAKGAVTGTGEILTGDPVGGAGTIVTETAGGAVDAVEGALAVPGNILFGK